ncbi:hypothetical protein CMV_014133 [Castanea mollissima]|uniref:Uncharacterized protein n=1 Tax=Castanea mollissima TaxID=60419 RepID=A0A8J4RBS3_9ROSI|nr:hypothetical protein CMV_014133 [Castanea mollissima]
MKFIKIVQILGQIDYKRSLRTLRIEILSFDLSVNVPKKEGQLEIQIKESIFSFYVCYQVHTISVSFALTKRPICLDAPIHAHVGRTVLKRDFDDSPNRLEEGKIQDILQQCGRMAYSCFNWAITVTMNMPLEKLHLFTSMVAS